MKKLIWIVMILTVFVSCGKNSSQTGDSDLTTDADQVDENADIDEIDNDLEESEDVEDEDQWYNAPVVKCEKDTDCPEPDKEFCDPYGECQCRRSDDYVIRYKGKCIHGEEGNNLFCNGRSRAFDIRHNIPRKGGIALAQNIKDLNCKCYTGYFGLNCEKKHENYPDIFPINDEYFLPEPNCSKDEDCNEGMKCGEKGYCYCEGSVVFDDPMLQNAVVNAVGKSDFTGEDLVNVVVMTLGQIQHLNKMECLPNLRALAISQPSGTMEINEIAKCQNLQYLHISQYNNAIFDFSPLLELKKLLILGLDLTKDNYKFLDNLDSENHLESLNFDFFKGDSPGKFDFIKKFKNLRTIRLFYGQSATLKDDCSFNISNFSNSPNLQYLLLYPGRCEITGLENLSKIQEIRELLIGNMVTDDQPTRHLHLSDFPVLPNVTNLWIDSTIFDGRLIDKFPAVTSLHIFGLGIEMKDLEYLEGLNNLRLLNITENYTDKVPFDDKRYDPIGKMPNLTELNIRNFSSRNYKWMSGLRHAVLVGLADENRYDEYVQNYNENGSDGTDQYSDLLYLSTYIDNTYHIDNVKGFREDCDKNGAFCNSSFWSGYLNENDYFPPSIGLCSNPLSKDDEDVQYLLNKGISFNIGADSQSCEALYGESYLKTAHPFFTLERDFKSDEISGSGIKWVSKRQD